MRWMELLLFALAGWSALGLIGVGISFRIGQRAQARRHAFWLLGVWVVYAVILGGTSLMQSQRIVSLGHDQCFGAMCFAVLGAEPVEALVPGETGAVVRVKIRVSNHGKESKAEESIRAYVIDSQGRRWEPLPGLSGNALTSRVAGGSLMLSEPVFRVAQDASGLQLIFTHGAWQPGRLVIGDSDSLGHRPTIVKLGP